MPWDSYPPGPTDRDYAIAAIAFVAYVLLCAAFYFYGGDIMQGLQCNFCRGVM